MRGRFCDFCIPIVLPHGTSPFRGSVRQDDRNAYFLCRPIVGLTPPKLPALGSNLRLHRGLYLCTDIVAPVMALYHNTNTPSNCQAFFTNFFKKFWSFVLNFQTPIFCGKALLLDTKYRYSKKSCENSKQMFAICEQMCYTLFRNRLSGRFYTLLYNIYPQQPPHGGHPYEQTQPHAAAHSGLCHRFYP